MTCLLIICSGYVTICLHFQDCHIEHIPALAFEGLGHLERLVIKTTLPEDRRLAIGIDGFVGIPGLKALEIPGNHLRSIPPNELCYLSQLRNLELSGNDISSLDDLGITNPDCLPELERLALAGNAVSR